jgi:2-octaprenyl-6-methoxyphenol hydroxylase
MTAMIWDAAVVGGGLAGRTAAIALARAGLSTVHLAPKAPPDWRSSALMQPSLELLQRVGAIDDPAALGVPLRRIRIIDATARLLRAPEALFDSADVGLEAFGRNIGNIALAEALDRKAADLPALTTRDATVLAVTIGRLARLTLVDHGAIEARLVVGADGRNSMVREAANITTRQTPFKQSALVCDLTLGRPLEGESVEFHYDNGPFTLVPAEGNRANLVWIDKQDVLEAAKASGAAGMVATFLQKSQRLFGAIELASPAMIFPLSSLTVTAAGAPGIALVGEAAHAFPPIGAQGLNLGLRDVADLVAAATSADRNHLDWASIVGMDYAQRRTGDLLRTGTAVDVLFRSLLADMLPAQALRAGGLWALKLIPSLRRQAFAIGMGAG